MGTQTGRISTSKPNVANVPRSPRDPLTEARNLLRRGKLHSKKKKHLRILDHGPSWKQHGCGSRYKVLRWQGAPPPEWVAVGWRLSNTVYRSRKEAYLVRKELTAVADVMDS